MVDAAWAAPAGHSINSEGVFKEEPGNEKLVLNHVSPIIGWGVENSTKYWLVRNAYGNPSDMKVIRGVNAFQIE